MKESLLIFVLCLFFPLYAFGMDQGCGDVASYDDDEAYESDDYGNPIIGAAPIKQYNKNAGPGWVQNYCVQGDKICAPYRYLQPIADLQMSIFYQCHPTVSQNFFEERYIGGVPGDYCPSVQYAQTKSNARYIAQNGQLVPAPRKTPRPVMKGEVRVPEYWAAYARFIGKTTAVDANNWDERHNADYLFVSTTHHKYEEKEPFLPGYPSYENPERIPVNGKSKSCNNCYEAKVDYNKTITDDDITGFHKAVINGVTVSCKSEGDSGVTGRCTGGITRSWPTHR
jgi:hypothetical protein